MTPEQNWDNTTGKLIVISGPSGVGKSTIAQRVVAMLDDAFLSVSMTTRAQTPREQDGRDYWFVSPAEFRRRREQGSLLESAEVFGNWYGTPRDKTDEALRAGKTVVLEIDVQGGRQVKEVYRRATLIFILPPSAQALAARMSGRGREDQATARTRLGNADGEIAVGRQYYDTMVVNDDLDRAVAEVVQIIRGAPTVAAST